MDIGFKGTIELIMMKIGKLKKKRMDLKILCSILPRLRSGKE